VAISVLVFAYCIELLQYFQLVDLLGVRENKVVATVLGSTFSWQDLIAYLFGFLIIIVVEKRLLRSLNKTSN